MVSRFVHNLNVDDSENERCKCKLSKAVEIKTEANRSLEREYCVDENAGE